MALPTGLYAAVQGRSDIVVKRVSSLPMWHRLDANEIVTVCHTRTADIDGIEIDHHMHAVDFAIFF